MKKSLFIITCFCSIITISCASKKVPVPEENLKSPTIELQNENSVSENDDAEVDSDNQIETNEESNSFSDLINLPDDFENQNEPQMEIIGQEEILLETESQDEGEITPAGEILQEIEEPEIITLEPEPEPEPEISGNQNEQSELNDSVLEVDVTDVEFQEENQTETEANSVNLEDENHAEDDDIVLLIESDNPPIDITNDNLIETLEEEIPEVSDEQSISNEEKSIPSRKVTLKRMEYLDISYPGRGWIYMGITDGSKDLSYFGRKLGTSDTNFTFQAKTAGTKILHFTKNDALQNEYIEDYIEVEILSEKGSNKTHVKAPEFKQQSKKNQNQSVKDDFSQETEQNVQKQETSSVSALKK